MHSPSEIAKAAKAASRPLRSASTATKNAVLERIAGALTSTASAGPILEANKRDLAAARDNGLAPAMVDRLLLDDQRLLKLQAAVREIIALPDPTGAISGLRTLPSGIDVGRMAIPLGVILMVYESRPNVTVDAAALCLKAGNAVILRGGKEAIHTNTALAAIVGDALEAEGLPRAAASFVDNTDREILYGLLQQVGEIDLAIPRGGTTLIEAVNEHARVPVIKHYQGICHVFVDETANLETATAITVNAKTHRPGVCNAAECLLVHQAVAGEILPAVVKALTSAGVELVGCERTRAIAPTVSPATPQDFDTEFLSLKMAIAVVDDDDAAMDFIALHGSQHTATIITEHHSRAMRFMRNVDASCVMINASTRFNDGGELGLGAELGISTTKLHAYGPMGLEELCTKKFVVFGHGEVRR